MDEEAQNEDNTKEEQNEDNTKEEQNEDNTKEEQNEEETQDDNKIDNTSEVEETQDDNKIEKTFEVEEAKKVEDFNYDDDFHEFLDYEDAEEYEGDYEKDHIRSSVTIDWEKEAKKTVHLESDQPRERRRTIYELDAYAASGPSKSDILKLSSTDMEPEQLKPPIRYSVSMGVSGIARINLSPLTQKVVGCVIGENVSTEYPWVYVRKEIIEDNIYLHDESSDFLAVKDEIRSFPYKKLLIGYVPSLTEEGQFYICLTEEARDAVIALIQKQREEHEGRVRTAVYKPARHWEDLGSGEEIQTSMVQHMRPLLEIEVVCTGDMLDTPVDFQDRRARDQRDGYVELLPYRQTFENVSCKLLYNATQVTPAVRDTESQTTLSVARNNWVQYEYGYQPLDISTFNEEKMESFKNFLHRFTDEVCDQLLLNATWDIYKNDYRALVRHERDTEWPIPEGYREHFSFHDEKHVVERVINDLCWHPLWTGVAFAAYTRHGKSQHLFGPKSYEEVVKADEKNYVLVWTFNDTLAPKLLLECPREVTTVAANPLDGNRIVGGCANGQVVLWHIPGKIEQIETVIVTTAIQMKYKALIRNLTTWMHEAVGSSFVRPTVMSSLKDSQKAAITQIEWLSPFDKVDKNGRIITLSDDEDVENLSSQFITASEDGTIAFWDLKLVQSWESFEQRSYRTPTKKFKSELHALRKSISPLKTLDRVLKPHYVLMVQHPLESRRQVITTLSINVPKFEKERVDVTLPTKDFTIRRFFRNIIKKPDFVMEAKINIGTVEGEFGCITWEGYDFATDLAVNTETCKWSWFKKMHDGPVTHAIRSRYDSNIIATIGGKVFAIWRDGVDVPLMWKKSDVRISGCIWGRFRPTVLILARMDGTVEIWDFMIKSQEPCIRQSLSGRIITGIYTHELHLDPYVIGFCDFNGILRVFLPPMIYLKSDTANIEWMEKFLERQIKRVNKCKDWQNKWKEANYENIKEKQRQAEEMGKTKQLEEEGEEKAKLKLREKEIAHVEIKEPITKRWELIEQARERWRARQLRNMQRAILEKKGLRKEELEKQREPILRMRQDAKKKKQKLQETLKMQEEIFEHSKNLFMPKRKPETAKVSIEADPIKIEASVEEVILQREVTIDKMDPNEEILYNFMQTQMEVLDELQKHPFQHSFNWRKILTEGKTRRISMDSELRTLTKAKKQ
ncbi:dynein axonemal intermediate chain 3-like [Osmia bicornis bicornis]|uniref:dynein axonemal intermediate chain 3-like n=1 Tax=Osmia bicornis bicornis TaxID=1437191 RepID=UPI001EAF5890|nr:dynein axonemal intermediate chain 3-like [Osmia bicornis bicornis]